ncbi:hypothetical protein PVW48_18380 [Dinoroseobacter sp. PD6]|uniref:hypothetical protein n=1 Tax=Dinoroseobacter sp. PD6 TaxID=3028384 RepID=UPI00237A2356|nr:hypothetical protein [Dinoroseobacter sp. PD6]MDD9718733.1 hypothetical protein [Dinoroseobacter sp. PD6]
MKKPIPNLGLFVGLALVLAACAPTIPDIPFDASEVAAFTAAGPGRIEGSALYRRRDGSIVTCAAGTVLLAPDTAFTREIDQRIQIAFPRDTIMAFRARYEDPALSNAFRRTVCDADGEFTFDGLAPGGWYVLTRIRTNPGNSMSRDGEVFLRQFIRVPATGTANPVLTNRDIHYVYSDLP